MLNLDTTINQPLNWPLNKANLKALGFGACTHLVLYFYPKDDTPGCTLEGLDFSRLKKKFAEAGAGILGVSRDSLKSHEKFCAKHDYTIGLVADIESKLCEAFGVMALKKNYGREYWGIERSTFLLQVSGNIVAEWRKVKVDGHAEEVLARLKAC